MSNFDDNPYAVTNATDDYGFNNQTPVHVPDYLVASILVTMFCCQPLGIAAIVYSALASGEKSTGNYAKAMSYAKNAKTCMIIGVAGVALIYLCLIGFVILSAIMENMH